MKIPSGRNWNIIKSKDNWAKMETGKGKHWPYLALWDQNDHRLGKMSFFLVVLLYSAKNVNTQTAPKTVSPFPSAQIQMGWKFPFPIYIIWYLTTVQHQSMIFLNILIHTDTSVLFNQSLKKPNPNPMSINYPSNVQIELQMTVHKVAHFTHNEWTLKKVL